MNFSQHFVKISSVTTKAQFYKDLQKLQQQQQTLQTNFDSMIENLKNSKLQKFLTETQFKAKQEQEQQKRIVYSSIMKLDILLEQLKTSLNTTINPQSLKSDLIMFKQKLDNAENSYYIAKDQLRQMEQTLQLDINRSMIILEQIKMTQKENEKMNQLQQQKQPTFVPKIAQQSQYTSLDALNDQLNYLLATQNILDQQAMRTYLNLYKINQDLNQRAFINRISKLLPQYTINQLNNEYHFAKQYIEIEKERQDFINKVKQQKIKQYQEQQQIELEKQIQKEKQEKQQKIDKINKMKQLKAQKEKQKKMLLKENELKLKKQKEQEKIENQKRIQILKEKTEKAEKLRKMKIQQKNDLIKEAEQEAERKQRILIQNNKKQLQEILYRNQQNLEKMTQISQQQQKIETREEKIDRLAANLAPKVTFSQNLYGLSQNEEKWINQLKQQNNDPKQQNNDSIVKGIDIFSVNAPVEFKKSNWM